MLVTGFILGFHIGSGSTTRQPSQAYSHKAVRVF